MIRYRVEPELHQVMEPASVRTLGVWHALTCVREPDGLLHDQMRLRLCRGHLDLDDRRHLDDLGNLHLVRHLGLHPVRRLDGHLLRRNRHERRRHRRYDRLLQRLGHRHGHLGAVLLHCALASCLGLDVVHLR